MKKLALRILGIWAAIIVYFFVTLYLNGRDIWKEEASAYPTRHAYVMLNNIALFRFLMLRVGVPDDSWIALGLESVSEHYFEQGLDMIPEEDAERLHWRYLHYLRPYQGGFVDKERVGDRAKLIDQAVIVATQYPYKSAKNNLILERYGFMEVSYSFELANFRYAIKGKPSKKEIEKFVISIALAYDALTKKLPLHTEEQMGAYGAVLFRSMELASALIFYNWQEGDYDCDGAFVRAYKDLRAQFPERIRKVMPAAAVAKGDVNRISQYQPKAEEILAKECNIHFN